MNEQVSLSQMSMWLGTGMVLVTLLAPMTAHAHAALVKSVPAQRASLYRAPAKIQLWFNERLEARYSSFSVLDGKGRPVETGPVEAQSGDPKTLAATLGPLPPGRYVVKYRVLSTDGHVIENQFFFSIRQ